MTLIAICLFFSATLIAALAGRPKAMPPPKYLGLLSLGLILRLAVALSLPTIQVFDDEVTYHELGASVAQGLQLGLDNIWEGNDWANTTAIIYFLFDDDPLLVRAINICLGLLTGVLLMHVAWILTGDERRTNRAFYFVLFSPPTIFISSLALKEQCVAFALALIALGFCRSRSPLDPVLFAGIIWLHIFRSDLLLLLLPPICLMFIARSLSWNIRRFVDFAVRGSLTLMAISIVAYLTLTPSDLENSKLLGILEGSDTRGESALARSEATYAQFLDVSNPGATRNILLAPLHSLFSPSPLRIVTVPGAPTVIEAVMLSFWTYLGMPLLLVSLVATGKSEKGWFLIILYFTVHFTAAYSILTAAPETFRYRWPGLPLLACIAGVMWDIRHRWRKGIIWSWWLAAIAFNIIYLRSFQG